MSDTRQHATFDLDDLRRLAHTQPLVQAALTVYDYGHVTLEQTLLPLTVALCAKLQAAETALESAHSSRPPSELDASQIAALVEAWNRDKHVWIVPQDT